MAFAARYKGTCSKCGKPIVPGQLIHWNRLARGSAWHHNCGLPDMAEPTADPVTIGDRLATSEQEQTVPEPTLEPMPLSKLHVFSDWHTILPAILPYTNRVLIIGPPGTGKSTTAITVAGIQHRITMTETTSREDLIGMFHLIDGATRWVDGPITAAMRSGSPVLTDEIDRYSPECASLFYGVIDDKPHIALPNGEIVHAADGYKMIMTSNESLDILPPAVQDRIEVILYAGTPHDAAIAHLPAAQRTVVSCYYKGVPGPLIKLPPTVRRMRTFHQLTSAGLQAHLAATLVFGAAGASEVTSAITSAESAVR